MAGLYDLPTKETRFVQSSHSPFHLFGPCDRIGQVRPRVQGAESGGFGWLVWQGFEGYSCKCLVEVNCNAIDSPPKTKGSPVDACCNSLLSGSIASQIP